MNIRKLVQQASKALDIVRKPVVAMQGFLVYVTAVNRPGLSTKEIYSEIVADNAAIGIETGPMPDGTDNVVNGFVYNVVDKVVRTLKDDAKVECTIPIGSVVVQANGANAGGAVVAVGTNINNAKGYGIIR